MRAQIRLLRRFEVAEATVIWCLSGVGTFVDFDAVRMFSRERTLFTPEKFMRGRLVFISHMLFQRRAVSRGIFAKVALVRLI